MDFYSGFVGKRVANVLKLEVGDVDVKVGNLCDFLRQKKGVSPSEFYRVHRETSCFDDL